ncbi:MAG: ParB N-terminal domain-containing protein [Deltaproteobacteria bacterium]|jgi:ParB-like chromosome segregation protein Spo0J
MTDLTFQPPRKPSAELDVVAKTLASDSDAVRGAAWVPLSRIRTHADLEQRSTYHDIDELAESIAKHDQLEPIGLWEQRQDGAETFYYTIWGHSRVRALNTEICGKRDAFARIYRNITLDQARQLAFVENFRRNDLTLYDQARQVKASLDRGWSRTTIEALTGLNRRTIFRLDALNACAERSSAFAAAAQNPRFPLRAAEAFQQLKGWDAPLELQTQLFELLLADPPLSLGSFRRQLAALVAGPTAAAKSAPTTDGFVDAKGNFRLPALRLKASATAAEAEEAVESLRSALRELRRLKRAAERREAKTADGED